MRTFHGLHLAAILAVATLSLVAQDTAPKMQKAADQRAWEAANSVPDAEARLSAYEAFLKTYPKSNHAGLAAFRRFELLLDHFPERTGVIEKAAKAGASDGKGFPHLESEAQVSEYLAEAGPRGVLLPRAEKWARNAEDHLNEAKFTAWDVSLYRRYGVEVPKAAELHQSYLEAAGNIHVALADVYVHEGKLALAKPLLDQALAAQPGDMTTNAVMGEYELAVHNEAEALTYFERAAVSGDNAELFSDLAKKYRPTLVSLYQQAHAGEVSGLDAALDARYDELFPAPFTPGKPMAIAGGHVALLELFTGSGCPPCVSADIALDTLLHQYARTHLIAISFDQHIPRPDPLANADAVARFKSYGGRGTPTFVLDGTSLSLGGAARADAGKPYAELERMVADEAARPSDVALTLAPPVIVGDNSVEVTASVATGTQAETAKLVEEPRPTEPPKTPEEQARATAAAAAAGKKTAANAAKTSPAASPAKATPAAPPVPRLAVNFALVEDEIRYSGENGVRVHRMVVRALAQPADAGFPAGFGTTSTVSATFDPAAVSAKLSDYLTQYAHSNERFGPLQWRSTPTALNPQHLYVVAWVQDLGTKRILQSAITPVLFPPLAATAKGTR